MTDANGVTVSNGYADNNAPYDVATATVGGKRFQKVIPCDSAGTPMPSGADSLVISTDTGTISGLTSVVCSTTPRYLVVEMWGSTFRGNVTLEGFIDAPSGTEIATLSGSIYVGSGASIPTTASSTNFTGSDTRRVFHISPVTVSQFRLRCSVYTSGTLNVRITNLNWPSNAREIGDLANVSLNTGALLSWTTYEPSFTYAGARVMGYDNAGFEHYPVPLSNNGQSVPTDTYTVPAATPAYGKIAGSSLTTSYQTLLTMGGAGKILQIWNSTEVPVIFSYDGGTTANLELGPYESESVDYAANGMTLASGTIQAKLVSGSAPVNGGSVRAKVTR